MNPVIQLDVDKVANALFRAFSRPGISKNYFEKIRNEMRIITVDGGSEFKSAFSDLLIYIFWLTVLLFFELGVLICLHCLNQKHQFLALS